MKNYFIFFLLILVHFGFSQENSNSPTTNGKFGSEIKSFDKMIVQGMEDWNIPGLATVVVKDGKIVFKKTYGVKNINSKEPVDGKTLFNMGSTTKAIVAMSLGILVDQGKLNWDDKVLKYLPDFRLSDDYIASDARVGDLLTHNLGIGNADMLWVLDSASTKETIKSFRYAKKKYPLRGGFEYQNIMYAVAGEVIEAVSGQHWTEFVEENIFKPLEMDRSQARSANILAAGNYVSPHFEKDDKVIRVNHTLTDQIGAAGMIWSSIEDIANYLQFILNEGVYKGDTIISTKTFKHLFEPKVILTENGRYPTNALIKPHFNTYSYGWFQQDYRGKKLNFHTGSLFGLVAIAGVMPEEKIAVYVFANMDHAELRHAIMYKAIDLFGFNDDSRNWNKEVFELYAGLKTAQTEAKKEFESLRSLDTKQTLDLKEYTGIYVNEMLGNLTVSADNNQLKVNINDLLVSRLNHWHYNTFMTEYLEKFQNKFPVLFLINMIGKVSEVEIMGEKFIRSE